MKSFATDNVTAMNSMFGYCKIVTLPAMNTPLVTTMNYMFYHCTELKTIESLDLRSVTTATSMFYKCTNIEDINLKNISVNLVLSDNSTYGMNLSADCLIGIIRELRVSVMEAKKLTIGATNLAKIADIYVVRREPTNSEYENDDLISEKLPFYDCESTTEGAMLITEYAASKGWSIV